MNKTIKEIYIGFLHPEWCPFKDLKVLIVDNAIDVKGAVWQGVYSPDKDFVSVQEYIDNYM